MHTDRSNIEKTKHIIIVAESRTNDNHLAVFINTVQYGGAFQQKFQPYFDKTEERRYLDYGSYVDCYSPIEFTDQEFKYGKLRGAVSEDDLMEIRLLLRENPQIPN